MHSSTKIFLIILLTILFIFIIWQVNIKVVLADHYFKNAISARFKKNWPNTLKNYEKIFNLEPNEPEYQRAYAIDLLRGLDFYKTRETKIKILDLATKRMNRISSQQQFFEVKGYLSRILSKKAELTNKKEDFESAEKSFQNLSAISPKMAGIYNDWCQLKIYEKNWQEAKEMCRKAWYLYPNLNNPEMNQTHRDKIIMEMSQVYEKLGQVYFNLKNYKKSRQMYVQVLKFLPIKKSYIWKKVADIDYTQGDIDGAIQKNLHGYALNPKDPAWPLAISLLYQKKGDPKMAEFYKNKSLGTVPKKYSPKTRINREL